MNSKNQSKIQVRFLRVRQIQETEIPHPFNTAQAGNIEALHIWQKNNIRIEFKSPNPTPISVIKKMFSGPNIMNSFY
ncbi:hypothetical protein MTR_5g009365 [Medicago truncatula]|uniref:Uncharacterized protein n=1 Tax=Medicago truncatula TaxID=3880 RepID=A0A072UNJ9_MEDTR|nr:hypothetical protein MTR_5g009365 [Medicago truncatula]